MRAIFTGAVAALSLSIGAASAQSGDTMSVHDSRLNEFFINKAKGEPHQIPMYVEGQSVIVTVRLPVPGGRNGVRYDSSEVIRGPETTPDS